MKNITIIAMLIAGTTLHSCHPGDKTTFLNVNASLKAAFNYKVGTYWIYQDSLSGEVDSFFVNGNSDEYSYSTTTPQTASEEISISIRENNITPISPADTQQYWGFTYYSNEIDMYYGEKLFNVNYAPFIYYPKDSFLAGDSTILDTGNIINIYNNYIVNGQTYLNVVVVNHHSDTLENIHNDTLFVAPSAGLIKMILNHPQDSLNKHRVWELQRYHLVK